MASGEAQITKMSSRGQVVIPEQVRNLMSLEEGALFAVFPNKEADSILLKQLILPEPKKAFDDMAKWATEHAKQKGLDTNTKTIVEKQHGRRK